jgi:hypothetical protein
VSDDEATLFEVPDDAYLIPPPPENLTRGERRQRLVAGRILAGDHPLGKGIRVHPDADRTRSGQGLTCGSCRFRRIVGGGNRSYPKCLLPITYSDGSQRFPRNTGCESSDVRKWWPACRDYQPTEE